MHEPFLEPILRSFRVRRVLPYVRRHDHCHLLDIGCGWEARFLKAVEPHISKGVGVDFKAPNISTQKIQTQSVTLEDSLPFADESFNVVSMLAVLEHLDQPEAILREIHRVLCVGGELVLTVPSNAAKPVLEFLAFRIGIVNPEEIADHKAYYNKDSLARILDLTGFTVIKHAYFQLGMNNFCVAKKS